MKLNGIGAAFNRPVGREEGPLVDRARNEERWLGRAGRKGMGDCFRGLKGAYTIRNSTSAASIVERLRASVVEFAE